MDKNTKFLMMFSFGGYFLIQLLIKSIGPPFSIIRNFWVSLFFEVGFKFDMATSRLSLINTVFYIAVIWFFLLTIKRIRDNKANAVRMLLHVILTTIVFLAIDMLITYLASLIISAGSELLYNYTVNTLIILSSVLYMISLVAIVNNESFTPKSIKKILSIRGYGASLTAAIILRSIPQIIPYALQQLTENAFYTGIAAPLLVSFAFMILVKPIFVVKS